MSRPPTPLLLEVGGPYMIYFSLAPDVSRTLQIDFYHQKIFTIKLLMKVSRPSSHVNMIRGHLTLNCSQYFCCLKTFLSSQLYLHKSAYRELPAQKLFNTASLIVPSSISLTLTDGLTDAEKMEIQVKINSPSSFLPGRRGQTASLEFRGQF